MRLEFVNITSLIKQSNRSLTELSSLLGISDSTLSDIVNGKAKNLTSDKLTKLADYFGVSTDYLLGRNEKAEVRKLKKELSALQIIIKKIRAIIAQAPLL